MSSTRSRRKRSTRKRQPTDRRKQLRQQRCDPKHVPWAKNVHRLKGRGTTGGKETLTRVRSFGVSVYSLTKPLTSCGAFWVKKTVIEDFGVGIISLVRQVVYCFRRKTEEKTRYFLVRRVPTYTFVRLYLQKRRKTVYNDLVFERTRRVKRQRTIKLDLSTYLVTYQRYVKTFSFKIKFCV